MCDDGGMDPLTAVVILAVVAAGAAVALLQMDQDATASLDVPLDLFAGGDLPAVCCKTGESADAEVKIIKVAVAQRKRFHTVVEGKVPVTKARFVEFVGWRDLSRKASVALVPLVIAGLALRLAADSIVVSWAVDGAALAVLFLAAYANAKARRLLVRPRRNERDGVTLRGVHPAFVAAVQASRRPNLPPTTAINP